MAKKKKAAPKKSAAKKTSGRERGTPARSAKRRPMSGDRRRLGTVEAAVPKVRTRGVNGTAMASRAMREPGARFFNSRGRQLSRSEANKVVERGRGVIRVSAPRRSQPQNFTRDRQAGRPGDDWRIIEVKLNRRNGRTNATITSYTSARNTGSALSG